MPRIREYGFKPGLLKCGKRNTIADVSSVTVGHKTLNEGDSVRTGVTVIVPGVKDLFRDKLPAAVYVGNGYGKLTGTTQIHELGTLETPIALTNTLAVGPAMQGLVELVLRTTSRMPASATINAVVGETNDGILNHIQNIVIQPADVSKAYETRSKDLSLGAVGAGAGTTAFGWKSGIGSASRSVEVGGRTFTVGALLQTNFGGALTILGVPIGRLLGRTDFDSFAPSSPDGSCMMVLATDAPLSSRQLGRIARRSMLGLARTGSVLGHGSGDYAIAFSTDRSGIEGVSGDPGIPDSALNPFFLAAVEAVEESVYDSLFCAETVTGVNGVVVERLPVETVVELLRKHAVTFT